MKKNQDFFVLFLSKSICFGVFAPGDNFISLRLNNFLGPLLVIITGCPCSSISIALTVVITFLKRPTSTLSPTLISNV